MSFTVAIYCPVAAIAYPWDPTSVRVEGAGGAEEAVVYLSEALAALGARVLVYGRPKKESSNKENPSFLPVERFQEESKALSPDVVVYWRIPSDFKRVTGAQHYLWLHDALPAKELSVERIEQFEGIFWLSAFQKECATSTQNFHLLEDPTRNFFFPNGVLLEQFPTLSFERNPGRCVYTSSYVRGLEQLLLLWPMIKKEHPEATLDIYYGTLCEPIEAQEKLQEIFFHIEELAPLGVKEHGRVGQERLAKELSTASLLLYPCTVNEVFCISSLKAALAGCVPVILEIAALKETVKEGFRCRSLLDYKDLACHALTTMKKEEGLKMRQRCRAYAEGFSWKRIARQWLQLFHEKKEILAAR